MASRLVAFAAALILLTAPALAQTLQHLHVRAFTLTSSTAAPKTETRFQLTVTVHVSEHVPQLANVFLPNFMGAEELGDERSLTQDAAGTTYRETLTLVAHASGPLSIGSAYLDAVDARDGKPKRFLSNTLSLTVAGPAPATDFGPLVRTLEWLFGLGVLGAGAVLLLRKRPAAPRPLPPLTEPEPAPVQAHADTSDPLERALAQLRTRRDRASVMDVRGALWEMLDARPGQTLHDVLRLPVAAHPRTRRLLLSVERAAFIENERLNQAIEEVLA